MADQRQNADRRLKDRRVIYDRRRPGKALLVLSKAIEMRVGQRRQHVRRSGMERRQG